MVPEDGPSYRRAMAPTDEQGRFSLTIPAQRSAAPAPSRMKVSARNGGRSAEVVGVKPGEKNVVVRLRPGTSVRGRVVRAGGSGPVKGFTLSVEPQGERSFGWGNTTWEFAADRFELRDVPAEPSRLVVHTADGAAGEVLATLGSEGTRELEIVVKGTAGVLGRVVDAATSAPVSEGLVMLEGQRPSGPGHSLQSNGRFTLEGLPPGEHTLLIMGGPLRKPERKQVTLVEGQVVDVGDIPLSQRPQPLVPTP
jgi:hypothetical protein